MNPVKAREHFDEPVTAEVLARAMDRGSKRRVSQLHAVAVQYVVAFKALLVSFADGSAIVFPVANYPEFAALSKRELDSVEVGFGGSALCLDSRDLHVSIDGLVSASQPLMELAALVIAARNGSKISEAKTQAARANGQKGGRPRKLATTD
ncbi:DUF2442 domain-containing protein [Bordetella sp. N]|uniref:DUF2442 domain-containing protein n=1 Tax=Bordetella sp. N TaxID=1746199 RepID=UPI00070AFC7A|nr:DUF2442 domain-containing protein [Bordetella sp. N]ALM84819.1 hypothetical protein ASB57_19210 [Bordetella sp. N]